MYICLLNLSSCPTYLEFFPALLATIPYELDSNVTKVLAILLTKPSVILLFCQLYLVILFQEKIIIIIIIIEHTP